MIHDVVIIGSGPAGYTAAIYLGRALLKPIIFGGREVGGQLTKTTEIENFPGFSSIMGPALMNNMKEQVILYGAELKYDYIDKVDFSTRPFKLYTDNGELFQAHSVIIATGATPKWLGLEEEKKFLGYGVSSCATCDGFFYKNKAVAVVGGGNTALEEALFLSKIAESVTLIHRRSAFRAEPMLIQKVLNTSNIHIQWNSVVKSIQGEETDHFKQVTHIEIQNTTNQSIQSQPVRGVFIAIGHQPQTHLFKDYIATNESGYIKVKDQVHTNIKGIFAAGDVMDSTYRQAITSAGFGCMAALEAQKFLLEVGIKH